MCKSQRLSCGNKYTFSVLSYLLFVFYITNYNGFLFTIHSLPLLSVYIPVVFCLISAFRSTDVRYLHINRMLCTVCMLYVGVLARVCVSACVRLLACANLLECAQGVWFVYVRVRVHVFHACPRVCGCVCACVCVFGWDVTFELGPHDQE